MKKNKNLINKIEKIEKNWKKNYYCYNKKFDKILIIQKTNQKVTEYKIIKIKFIIICLHYCFKGLD